VTRDTVFRQEHPEIAEFAFDEKVSAVFADMLKRSVPGYGAIISMIAVFAKKYVQKDTAVYDLGCSLGACSLAVAQNVECRILAYDVSEPMIKEAKKLLKESEKEANISFFCEDITKIDFEKSSFVALNLVLQFIKPDNRAALLKKINDSLTDGGVLILTEKISDTSDGEFFTDVYYDFKQANGYSELEIAQKRAALENVLVTDSEKIHTDRLKSCGFKKVERWFQALNFRSYIAWK